MQKSTVSVLCFLLCKTLTKENDYETKNGINGAMQMKIGMNDKGF